jgi:hypothetical protein
MQTTTGASSIARKLSRVARFDLVKLVQKLVQKCIILSPESGNSCFDWLGLGIESAVAFDALPEHVSFLAGPLDSVPIPSPPPPPPLSPPLPMPSPITTIDNLSSHRNRLQPPRTHATATHATAEVPINPIDNVISYLRALRASLQTPRTQVTQATAEEPTTSTVRTFSSLRELRNRFQQARTQPNTNSTDTWRFFPGHNSPSKA